MKRKNYNDRKQLSGYLGYKGRNKQELTTNSLRGHSDVIQNSLKLDQNDDCVALSVQFSRSIVSDSLQPRESQHARPPHHQLPEFTQTHVHRVSDAISSSVVRFSSCPQSLPASESCPMSQLFAWGGQSTGASALASFLPKKSQGWFSTYILGECIIRPHLPLHGRVSL